jgi:hypothetical protein
MGKLAGDVRRILILIGALALGLTRGADAAIQFQKIAGTGTPLPNGGGNFVHFIAPKIDGDNVVFQGYDDNGFTGIYSRFNGALATVADSNTPAPGGGSFNFLADPHLEGQTVEFGDFLNGVHRAIYLKSAAGPIAIVANQNTPAPNGVGNFNGFIPGSVRLKSGNVAFIAGTPGSVTGVFTKIGATFARVADTNTAIPGSLLLAKYGYFTSVGFDGQSVAFTGGAAQGGPFVDRSGVHTNLGGALHVIANLATPVPGGGGGGAFEDYSDAEIANGQLYFRGVRSPDVDALYLNAAPGVFTPIAGINMPGPAGSVFTAWGGTIVDDSSDVGNLLASGIDSSSPQGSYYARIDGQWSVVIRQHDILDGKEIVGFNGADLNGHTVVFAVTFSDLSGGVYAVTVPEPSTVLGGAGWGGIALLLARHRRERTRRLLR